MKLFIAIMMMCSVSFAAPEAKDQDALETAQVKQFLVEVCLTGYALSLADKKESFTPLTLDSAVKGCLDYVEKVMTP